MKSTHRGFRGPNNFLLAHRTFLYRNRTSFFRRRIDRCRCLDRSRCSKTIETGRKNHSVCYMSVKIDASRIASEIFAIPKERLHGIHGNLPIVFLHSAFLNIFSSFSLPFHFTISPQSSLRPSASFSFFFLSFLLPFLLSSLSFPFLFLPLL